MIISHEHRYLFVELPRTGSTAISKELQELYGGKQILKKHATYRDFLKVASTDEKGYFVFSAVRNPMDRILSLYFKYKTDHRDYANPNTFKYDNPYVTWLLKTQFRFVTETGADFPTFFKKFYRVPYDDWSSLDHKHFDFIIRFEYLSEDFREVLRHLGIEPIRPLPVKNNTKERDKNFLAYYSPEIRNRAKWVFGPYFKRWGYEFPEEWGSSVPRSSEIAFAAANVLRHAYWRYLR